MSDSGARSVSWSLIGCVRPVVTKTWGMSELAGRSAGAQRGALRLIGPGLKDDKISRVAPKQERNRGGDRGRHRE
jgi:hypothetical protein